MKLSLEWWFLVFNMCWILYYCKGDSLKFRSSRLGKKFIYLWFLYLIVVKRNFKKIFNLKLLNFDYRYKEKKGNLENIYCYCKVF